MSRGLCRVGRPVSGCPRREFRNARAKRKKDASANNLRTDAHPKDRRPSRRPSNRPADRQTLSKSSRDRLAYEKRSLENVSSVVRVETRDDDAYPPSLRRCRSLALTKEDVFNSLEITNDGRPSRRAQLIPRAKLHGRGSREQSSRYGSYRASNEELYSRPIRPRLPSESHYQQVRQPRQQAIPRDRQLRIDENEYDSLEYRPAPPGRRPDALNLPNYYPDSVYESDNTEYAPVGENRKKYQSCDSLPIQNFQLEPESISYDENIVLSKNRPLYGSLQDAAITAAPEKPKTIRSPAVLKTEEYFSAPSCRSERSTEPENVDEKDPTDNIYASVEVNPVYEKVEGPKNEEKGPTTEFATKLEITYSDDDNETSKTVIEIDAPVASYSTDEDTKEEEEDKKEQKHSHKYLKEFLESQKGSKKPLQNFLSKKFPNLSRRNSKEKELNLIDNNFYSLPDLAACKNLKKCDKIDRRLRKCDRAIKSGESDDRFIVNIGRHFDVTANDNIPVDFELKIAKIPKKKKSRNEDKPEALIQAIKDLKKSLGDNNQDKKDTKPEIIAVQRKSLEEPKMNKNQTDAEYQDKLDTMRNYWKKLTGDETKNREEHTKTEHIETKVEEVKKKFEPPAKTNEQTNKVKKTKEMFEKKTARKTSHINLSRGFFENPTFEKDNPFESLNPNAVEVIESKEETQQNDNEINVEKETNKQNNTYTKSVSITYPEFDHVRYRVVKSNLFQKQIFANYEKESQFDGLMQYLQDYSFQELLMENNIVIIEPIRTTLIRENNNKYHQVPSKNITPLLHTNKETKNEKNTLKKHFFFHPIRVNKEVNDDELPNPDTVKQVRQMFEKKGINSTKKVNESNGDKTNGHKNVEVNETWDDFDEEACCEQQYITEDMMEKIRKYGTTITYYGGRIVRKQSSQESLTNVILEEIKNNEIQNRNDERTDENQRLRFKLVKSNSCSSRMELVGTKNLSFSKQKYRDNQNKMKKQVEEKRQEKIISNNNNNDEKILNKNRINENIKEQNMTKQENENKIYTKWGENKKEQTIYGIKLNDKLNDVKVFQEYHSNSGNYKSNGKIIEDMDFEPFEVA